MILLYVTLPDSASAETIGRELVEARLAACVNILPGMISLYRWQGAIDRADEVVLLVKTVEARAAEATTRILALHPYDTPCVMQLPVTGGNPAFLAWIAAETTG